MAWFIFPIWLEYEILEMNIIQVFRQYLNAQISNNHKNVDSEWFQSIK